MKFLLNIIITLTCPQNILGSYSSCCCTFLSSLSCSFFSFFLSVITSSLAYSALVVCSVLEGLTHVHPWLYNHIVKHKLSAHHPIISDSSHKQNFQKSFPYVVIKTFIRVLCMTSDDLIAAFH